jgi:hypothetical protein
LWTGGKRKEEAKHSSAQQWKETDRPAAARDRRGSGSRCRLSTASRQYTTEPDEPPGEDVVETTVGEGVGVADGWVVVVRLVLLPLPPGDEDADVGDVGVGPLNARKTGATVPV